MWKQDWTIAPQSADELFAWRVFTRVWKDVGFHPPGQYVVMWMKRDLKEQGWFVLEAIHWYINECNE